jgi:hypothetical protein
MQEHSYLIGAYRAPDCHSIFMTNRECGFTSKIHGRNGNGNFRNGPRATDAFIQSPLCRAFRWFTGPIVKARFGSSLCENSNAF